MLAALEALLRLRQAACHPGLVPGQTRRVVVEGRAARRGARRRRRGRSQGARLLAVDVPARSRRAAAARRRHRVHAARRLDARSRRRRRAIPGRRGPAGDADLAQGRRHRPQPHRRRSRLPARPVVEPRRRGSGRRPRAPHRADAPGDGLPPGRRGHRRGAHPRAAGEEARARRRRARRRRPPPRRSRATTCSRCSPERGRVSGCFGVRLFRSHPDAPGRPVARRPIAPRAIVAIPRAQRAVSATGMPSRCSARYPISARARLTSRRRLPLLTSSSGTQWTPHTSRIRSARSLARSIPAGRASGDAGATSSTAIAIPGCGAPRRSPSAHAVRPAPSSCDRRIAGALRPARGTARPAARPTSAAWPVQRYRASSPSDATRPARSGLRWT